MATKDISIIIKALDHVTQPLKKIGGELDGFAKRNRANFGKMARVGTRAFAGLVLAVKGGSDSLSEYESLTTRLKHITQTSTGATDEQVSVLIKQAEALEKVGVASKESIVQAQAQLATFDLQTDTIQRLIPSITDYVIAEKGATASADDFKQMTNGLAQALNGNFSSLTRIGFVLDENTKEMIANGTEMERAEALAKVLDGTYGGFNSTIAQTSEGVKILRDRELGNLQENIAKGLVPIINKFNEVVFVVLQKVNKWIEDNPKLADTIIKITLAVSGIVAVIGTLGLVLGPIIVAFKTLAVVIGVLTSPIGLIIAAIGLLAVAFYKDWGGIRTFTVNVIKILWDSLKKLIDIIKNIYEFILPYLKAGFETVMNYIYNISEKTVGFAIGLFDGLRKSVEGVINFANGAYEKVKSIGAGAKNIASSIGEGITGTIGSITGKKAFGGPVQANKPYLVGERGPEIFTPGSSGMIRNNTNSSPTININLGGVIIQNERDENKLIEKIKRALIKDTLLFNNGIS